MPVLGECLSFCAERSAVAESTPARASHTPVAAAALAGAGVPGVPIDATTVDETVAAWREAGITHAISIERCGRSRETGGSPRSRS